MDRSAHLNPSLTIVFDVRCLQDENYRGRGVGRHSANLLRFARINLPAGATLVAMADPRMPALPAEHAVLFDHIRPNAYAAMFDQPTWFIELSPMMHDPMYVARLVSARGIFRAAVVYDFIPEDEPGRYLPTVAHRLGYALAKYWLAHYDLFLPLSHATASRLTELLRVSSDRITVTGAPVDPIFERPPTEKPKGQPPGYVLTAGGAAARKNVECAIRAHAGNRRLQIGGICHVITGRYPEAWKKAFADLHLASGGKPGLLRFSGSVSDAELVDLYRSAACVVVPSRTEGFSLPVVEAMAVGTPVIASKIPAHKELIAAPDLLFDPEDADELSRLIGRLVEDPEHRQKVVAAEATAWQRFRGEEVARIFWSAVQAAAPTGVPSVARPSVRRGRKAQVAVLSPLPPDRSGVADFTAASLPELGAVVEVHVFSDTASPAKLEGAASLRPLSSFPALYADFDRVVVVVGNSHFHTGIFDVLLRYGGACIEHDSRMLGFYRICLGVERATHQAERELKRRLHEGELTSWLADENTTKALFLGELAAAAEPLFLHSARTVRLVRERYGADAVHLPFAIHRPWPSEALTPEARAEARSDLNIPTSEIAIATFGMVHHTKGPVECIWAIEMLRSWGIPANLYFVGAHKGHAAELKSLCREIGVESYVRFLGDAEGAFVGEQLYRRYLQGVDFGIQLRTVGFGSVSAALVDCIAAGLGTVTNEDLADAVDAPDYVARVPDHLSPVLIAEALADLIDRKLHTHRSEGARRAYYDAHNFGLYTRRLCAALALDVPAETSE